MITIMTQLKAYEEGCSNGAFLIVLAMITGMADAAIFFFAAVAFSGWPT